MGTAILFLLLTGAPQQSLQSGRSWPLLEWAQGLLLPRWIFPPPQTAPQCRSSTLHRISHLLDLFKASEPSTVLGLSTAPNAPPCWNPPPCRSILQLYLWEDGLGPGTYIFASLSHSQFLTICCNGSVARKGVSPLPFLTITQGYLFVTQPGKV
jgi:hypothetical protein